MDPEPLFVMVVIHAVDGENEQACLGDPGLAQGEEIAADLSGEVRKLVFSDDEFAGVLTRPKPGCPLSGESVNIPGRCHILR